MSDERLIARSWGNPSAHPITPETAQRVKCRPAGQRTALPVVGQKVWYRHDAGGPLVLVTIERVDLESKQDWNVWRFKIGNDNKPLEVKGVRQMEMVDDPWPDVYFRMPWGMVVTREARVEGLPGWIPMKAS